MDKVFSLIKISNIRKDIFMKNVYAVLQEKLSLNQFPLSAKYNIQWIIVEQVDK